MCKNLWDLTEREHEVLCLLAAGYRRKRIAIKLEITDATVKAHVRNIMMKLVADNSRTAIRIAQRQGLLTDKQIPEICN